LQIRADTLADMIAALGEDVCSSYRAAFREVGADVLCERRFDPRTLTVLNLNLRSSGNPKSL